MKFKIMQNSTIYDFRIYACVVKSLKVGMEMMNNKFRIIQTLVGVGRNVHIEL